MEVKKIFDDVASMVVVLGVRAKMRFWQLVHGDVPKSFQEEERLTRDVN